MVPGAGAGHQPASITPLARLFDASVLAAALWAAIKFHSHRKLIPGSTLIHLATGACGVRRCEALAHACAHVSSPECSAAASPRSRLTD
jgi:hypothetical protein